MNTLKVSADDYARALARSDIAHTLCDFPSGCITLHGGSVTALPGFEEGLFYVQDRAARMAVEIAAPKKGDACADACSAPGGKAFPRRYADGEQGQHSSCDIHEKKLALLYEGAERLGIDIITTEARDARRCAALEGAFDVVIADVPCSGIGVIRKKPEIRCKDPQRDRGAARDTSAIYLPISPLCERPGGTLLYSTCTVLGCENEGLSRAFSKANDYALEPFTLGAERAESGMRTFFQNTDGTDGFFAARLKRIK